MDLVSQMMAYEQGEMDADQTLNLFSELIKSGDAWKLQGHYGRMANQLISHGFLTREGDRPDRQRRHDD